MHRQGPHCRQGTGWSQRTTDLALRPRSGNGRCVQNALQNENSVVPRSGGDLQMNAGLSYTMTCGTGSFMEEAHAFEKQCDCVGPAGPDAGRGLAADGDAAQGCRMEVHLQTVVADRIAGRSSHEFGLRGLPRSGRRSLRSGGSQRPDGLFAGASADARTVAASGALRAAVARGDLSQCPAGRHRLASDPLPRTAAPACQRTVSQPAQVGDEQISRLRHGLRRRTGLSLHPRCDVGQRERVAAGRARTVARSSAGAGAEDQKF